METENEGLGTEIGQELSRTSMEGSASEEPGTIR